MGCLLKIDHLNKRFGATKALTDVCLQIESGETHALLGENGAGKSTLIKILSGALSKDLGKITFLGENYEPNSVKDAISSGISTAFQEFSLLPNLTVAENILLPYPPKNMLRLTSRKSAENSAKHLLNKFNISDISVSQKVASLSVAQKQRLETVKALIKNPKLLILDEPTAALYDPEWLYRHVESFLDNGSRAVLFITHRLRESRRLCKHFTVLQNGRHVATSQFKDTTDKEVFSLMTGKTSFEGQFLANSERIGKTEEKPLLVGRDLRSDKRIKEGEGINIVLKPGEIYGIAGLEGQGQRELFGMLGGTEPIVGGNLELEGRTVSIRNPRTAGKFGIILLPEERKVDGIFPGLKTAHNLSIRVIDRIKNRLGLIAKRSEISIIRPGSEEVYLDQKYLEKPIESLSGGNQQKAILASALLANAKCLLLFDPTRGVDIGTKQNIYHVIQKFASKGKSVLFYSTELPEIVGLANRCGVFYQQKIVKEIESAELSEDRVLKAMLGYTDERGDKPDDKAAT